MIRPIAKVLLISCATASAGIVLLVLAIFVMLLRSETTFDQAHPDFPHFAERFAEARRAFTSGDPLVVIDLAPLNGGVWRTACLFGGYNRPIEEIEKVGGAITQTDRDRLSTTHGFRIAPVEEFEMLIAFMDETRRAHFIHFPEGVGPEGQHYKACATKPETAISIERW